MTWSRRLLWPGTRLIIIFMAGGYNKCALCGPMRGTCFYLSDVCVILLAQGTSVCDEFIWAQTVFLGGVWVFKKQERERQRDRIQVYHINEMSTLECLLVRNCAH